MGKAAAVCWPPPAWEENDFHREPETRLPRHLHPFYIMRDRATGLWSVHMDDKVRPLAEGIDGIFAAFRAMLDHYERWFPTRPISQVYFIGTELTKGALIKVGVSLFPEKRLAQLQTGHGKRLKIFATTPGDTTLETKYHRRWHLRRQEGEWFVMGATILAEIDRLNAPSLARGERGVG